MRNLSLRILHESMDSGGNLVKQVIFFFFSSRRRHTRSVSAFLLNRSSDLTNLLKFMRASIKMIGVSNLQSFIASMTQKLTLSDITDESKNYLDKAGITTACLRIKSKWTAGGK